MPRPSQEHFNLVDRIILAIELKCNPLDTKLALNYYDTVIDYTGVVIANLMAAMGIDEIQSAVNSTVQDKSRRDSIPWSAHRETVVRSAVTAIKVELKSSFFQARGVRRISRSLEPSYTLNSVLSASRLDESVARKLLATSVPWAVTPQPMNPMAVWNTFVDHLSGNKDYVDYDAIQSFLEYAIDELNMNEDVDNKPLFLKGAFIKALLDGKDLVNALIEYSPTFRPLAFADMRLEYGNIFRAQLNQNSIPTDIFLSLSLAIAKYVDPVYAPSIALSETESEKLHPSKQLEHYLLTEAAQLDDTQRFNLINRIMLYADLTGTQLSAKLHEAINPHVPDDLYSD